GGRHSGRRCRLHDSVAPFAVVLFGRTHSSTARYTPFSSGVADSTTRHVSCCAASDFVSVESGSVEKWAKASGGVSNSNTAEYNFVRVICVYLRKGRRKAGTSRVCVEGAGDACMRRPQSHSKRLTICLSALFLRYINGLRPHGRVDRPGKRCATPMESDVHRPGDAPGR